MARKTALPAPFLVTALVAVASGGLLVLGIGYGWWGPDVGRGAQFCEAPRDAVLKQPANTLSNLGFVLAGLAFGWQSSRRAALPHLPGVATGFACILVLLGPASAAMHATQSDLGGRLDMASMYLVASAAAAVALTRWRGWGSRGFWTAFGLMVLGCEAVATLWRGHVPVVEFSGNVAFAALLVTATVLEVRLWRRDRATDLRWGIAVIGSMALAFALWNLSQHRWCDPHSLLQGHAAWHLLCALAGWCLAQLYASERTPNAVGEVGVRTSDTTSG